MPTVEDVWVESAFGVRPADYEPAGKARGEVSIGNPFAKLKAKLKGKKAGTGPAARRSGYALAEPPADRDADADTSSDQ